MKKRFLNGLRGKSVWECLFFYVCMLIPVEVVGLIIAAIWGTEIALQLTPFVAAFVFMVVLWKAKGWEWEA